MPLSSISPIDGRYRATAEPLAKYFSEQALMKFRLIVEGEYLISLSEAKIVRKLTDAEKKLIRSLYNLSEQDAQIISDIETKGYKNIKATDHDVKAVEYFMKDRLGDTSLKDVLEYIHFALTSEDTNNMAYGIILSESLETVIIAKLGEIIESLNFLIKKSPSLPMLARTHGQPASPTTFGKEFKVFTSRLNRQLEILKNQKISVS